MGDAPIMDARKWMGRGRLDRHGPTEYNRVDVNVKTTCAVGQAYFGVRLSAMELSQLKICENCLEKVYEMSVG